MWFQQHRVFLQHGRSVRLYNDGEANFLMLLWLLLAVSVMTSETTSTTFGGVGVVPEVDTHVFQTFDYYIATTGYQFPLLDYLKNFFSFMMKLTSRDICIS
jgi:hypothetical protein